ncbi:MAG TPA: TetR/AcrR family transcriptional regulator [Clostridiales bacterium]|nr:TetR/AcrR family transcriptional regulator [Clostridiales bacterium]
MGEKGKKTIERIKNESLKLFVERGYKDVSMQDICNAAGLSKGGLYRHFGSKAEILLSLTGEERKIDVLAKIANKEPAVQILNEYLDEFYQNMLMSDKSLAYALFEYATVEKENALLAKDDKDSLTWKSLIDYGIKTGEFNDIDYEPVMHSFLFAYRGVRIWSRAIEIDEDIIKSIIENVKLMVVKNYRRTY